MFRPLRIFIIAIGALLVLLGVIAVLGVVFSKATFALWPFHDFFFGRLFGLLFVLLLLFFGLRLLLWPFRYRRLWSCLAKLRSGDGYAETEVRPGRDLKGAV